MVLTIQKFQKYFNRFEIKYQISLQERDRLLNLIQPFMRLDPHVTNNYDYEVRSLYFDSNFQHSFIEKINGIAIRKKLRIRYYPDFANAEEKFAFIEIKKKINENVAKSRVFVPLTDAVKILNENSNEALRFFDSASAQDQQILKEIWWLNKRYNLKATCIVSYKRRPFLSKLEKTFRLILGPIEFFY